jgi:hypothetical protein
VRGLAGLVVVALGLVSAAFNGGYEILVPPAGTAVKVTSKAEKVTR